MSYDFHKQFINETFNENGEMTACSFNIPENFNFGYDVTDVLAAKYPDRRAMLWISEQGEEKTVSFGDVSRESSRAAAMLSSLGLKKGDKCMIILKRRLEFWYIIIALHKLGVTAIPATNQLAAKDIAYRLNAAGINGIIALNDCQLLDEADKSFSAYASPLLKVCIGCHREGWLDYYEELEKAPEFVRPAEVNKNSDTMLLYFTSGTTGMPKMVTHDYTYPLAHIVTAKYWHKVVPDGLHLTISETGWMKSMWGKLYGQWLMEAGIFVYDLDRFNAADILSKIEKYKITTFCAPPTMYRFFIREDMAKYDLSSLVHATTAGEALNPEVFERFRKYTGLTLMEGFGQTETTLTVVNFYWATPRIGSMGKPSPAYNVNIRDSEGQVCRPGVVGEIVLDVRGGKPCGMFSGYYMDNEKLATVLYDGFYHTGDTAWMDEDGYYWYVGRTDDLIKSSGYRIGPFEVESVIMEHPSVLECAVTGAPDPVRGQVVKASIVLAPGYTASEELSLEIKNYVKSHTAPYKYPRIIEFIPELPKTISGKIRRNVIRES